MGSMAQALSLIRRRSQTTLQLGRAKQRLTHPGGEQVSCPVSVATTTNCLPLALQLARLGIPTAGRIISQSDTASRDTRSRMRGRRPFSVTTSTRRPSSSCVSIRSPPRSSRLRPGSKSTKKSTSLSPSASPRATEPKTRIFRAPWTEASLKISSRFCRRRSCIRIRLGSPEAAFPSGRAADLTVPACFGSSAVDGSGFATTGTLNGLTEMSLTATKAYLLAVASGNAKAT